MDRSLLILSFLATGLLPFGLGAYLAYKGDYYLSVGCFFIAIAGFQQIYQFLKIIDNLSIQIMDQQKAFDTQREQFGLDQKQLTHNLGLMFSEKMDETNRKIEDQKKRLCQADNMIEQRNKEIRKLQREMDDYY